MISLKQLHYALAVEKNLHFKKASDDCSVSQSALSTAVNELEKQLGFQIFERDNKKVLVTPLGKQFLTKAQEIMLQVDDLYQLVNEKKAPLSHEMSIGVIPTIGPYLLPKVLPGVREQYPNFPLKIVEEQSHVLVEMVRSGAIDAAILALPYNIENLLSFEFWQEDFYWIAHKSQVPKNKKVITSDELYQAKLMLLKEGHCLKDHALAACKLKDADTQQAFSTASLHTLTQMVAGRLGTTLVPQMALDQLVSGSSELAAVRLSEPGPHRKIAFVVRPNYAGLHNVEVLMALFKKALTEQCI